MRESFMLVLVLTLVCLISALALALVNNLTVERIAEQKKAARLQAVKAALPEEDLLYNNDPSQNVLSIPEWKEKDGTPKIIYIGRRDSEIVGVAFTSVGEGYGGFISVMMGANVNGDIAGIEILEHLETPGLGANIDTPRFKGQFRGKLPANSLDGKIMVIKGIKADKDWEIEALTGATVSSLGVAQAINDGLMKFQEHKDKILAGGAK